MKKLADLYFDYDVKSGEYISSFSENMKKEDESLVKDLMNNSKVKVQINNACRNINKMERKDQDVEITAFNVNLSSSISSSSNLKIIIKLLKEGDDSDMLVSLYSLVYGPTN